MKIKVRVCSVISALVMGFAGLSRAQMAPPPNDNFTNRIELTGTDVSFDGTLAGATVESAANEITPPSTIYLKNGVTESVWWDWTAPESETVLVQISNPSQQSVDNDAIAVYSLNDISSGQFISGMALDTPFPEMFFAFEAVAGTDYQIQLAGSDGTSFHFRLLATNSPYIIEQPRSQTITTGDSVLFTVIAASGSTKGYQWQFNSTNLPGETTPMLAFDSPDVTPAGPYRVIITNATGAVTSQVATLWMTTNDTMSALRAAVGSTNSEFAFSLLGDMGRRYRLQSSTDLRNWAPEASFSTRYFEDAPWGPLNVTSVVIDWSGAEGFALPQTTPLKLFRASPYHAQNEVCNNHLKQIRFAQLLLAYENHLSVYSAVNRSDFLPYFKDGQMPVCPLGGFYNFGLGPLMTPACFIQGHILEEP
jgi:hypothetical protein